LPSRAINKQAWNKQADSLLHFTRLAHSFGYVDHSMTTLELNTFMQA